MARTRDFRRYQYELRKLRVRKRLRWWEMEATPFRLGRYANTPKPCSCYMCGNPHRYWNEMTRQELRAEIIFSESIDRMGKCLYLSCMSSLA